MHPKQEKQKKYEEKLNKKFEDENISLFIQRYFINIESKAGAINYWIAIRDLLVWLMEKKVINKNSLSEITPEDFYEIESEDVTLYLREKENNGMLPTTLKTRKNIFSSFWRYLSRSNKCPVNANIIESVAYKGISSNNNILKKFPDDSQMKEIEEKINSRKNDFLRIRNQAIFRLLKGSGIRESELVELNTNHLFLNEEIPYIKILGKGKYHEREERIVYITEDAKNALIEWLNERSKNIEYDSIIAVFISKNGKRMLESEIVKLIKNMSNSEVTPHMIRHWYATIMAKKCGIVFTQQNLGHTSMNTTINNYANGAYSVKETLSEM